MFCDICSTSTFGLVGRATAANQPRQVAVMECWSGSGLRQSGTGVAREVVGSIPASDIELLEAVLVSK